VTGEVSPTRSPGSCSSRARGSLVPGVLSETARRQDGRVDLAAMLPAIVVLHGIVLVAIALVLARVLPRYFQRRQRDERPHRS
jgi:hypothetical protein